uniref:Uncharacterized protein n=1 Tax=Cyprinus carpio TaxID=7962 RepID=A0A8C1WXB7_CYPCA
MSRICKKKPAVTVYGPTGKLKQIHNNVGGHVLTTSTSTALLKRVDMSELLLKMISIILLFYCVFIICECAMYCPALESLCTFTHSVEFILHSSFSVSSPNYLFCFLYF